MTPRVRVTGRAHLFSSHTRQAHENNPASWRIAQASTWISGHCFSPGFRPVFQARVSGRKYRHGPAASRAVTRMHTGQTSTTGGPKVPGNGVNRPRGTSILRQLATNSARPAITGGPGFGRRLRGRYRLETIALVIQNTPVRHSGASALGQTPSTSACGKASHEIVTGEFTNS